MCSPWPSSCFMPWHLIRMQTIKFQPEFIQWDPASYVDAQAMLQTHSFFQVSFGYKRALFSGCSVTRYANMSDFVFISPIKFDLGNTHVSWQFSWHFVGKVTETEQLWALHWLDVPHCHENKGSQHYSPLTMLWSWSPPHTLHMAFL